MKLILDGKDFEHITEISCYNNNYFKHRETGIVIYEHCDENYQINEYADVTNTEKTYFLGCCPCSNGESLSYDEEIEVEFKIQYT